MNADGENATGLANSGEKLLAAAAGNAESGEGPLAGLEEDLRQLMRAGAEARRALEEEKRNYIAETRKHLLALVEVADAFDRVLANIEDKKEDLTGRPKIWVGNFQTVRRLLGRVLADAGVSPIENLGPSFDPGQHKVMETVRDASRPEGTIVHVVVRGYCWHGELLRKSEVVVVCNADAPDGPAPVDGAVSEEEPGGA